MKRHFVVTAPVGSLIAILTMLFSVLSVSAQPSEVQHGNQYMHVQNQAKSGGGTSNMSYHGGAIETGTTINYVIYWGAYPSQDQSIIQSYFQKVGGSSFFNINTQYTDSTGTHASNLTSLGGSWTDPSGAPANVSDAQVQQEVSRAASANGWSFAQNHEFFVFTPNGTNICNGRSCSYTQFCAYHSHFNVNSAYALYSAMPYAGTNLAACGVNVSPNNDVNADSELSVTSHEQFETVTDPLGTAWYDSRGSEIGDKCAWTFGPAVNSSGADVVLGGQGFYLQREWSNAITGCTMTY